MSEIISTDNFLTKRNIERSAIQVIEVSSIDTFEKANASEPHEISKPTASKPENISTIEIVTIEEITEDFLERHGTATDAALSVVEQEETGRFLERKGAADDKSIIAITDEEVKLRERLQRLRERTTILYALVGSMGLIPIWLMILLSLPVFNIKPYSEKMQLGFLAALATDVVGLFYVVTRDLFPSGNEASKRRISSSNSSDEKDS